MLGDNKYTTEDVIMYSEMYKNEAFMKSREAYVRALCSKLKLNIGTDIDFLVYLLDGAAEPDLHIIDGKELEKKIVHLFETTREYIQKNINNQERWNTINQRYKHYLQHVSNNAFNSSGLHITQEIRQNGDQRIISCSYSIGQLRCDYYINYTIDNHDCIQLDCQSHVNRMFYAMNIQSYVDLALLCIRSFKRYENLWHKKMMHHLAKSVESVPIIKKQLTDLDTRVAELECEDEQAAIRERVEDLNTHINECKAETEQIGDLINIQAAIREQLKELEKKVSNNYLDLSLNIHPHINNKQTNNTQKHIRSLQDSVKYLKEQIKNGKTAFNSLNAEVAELRLQLNQNKFIKSVQILPVYDYAEIKANRANLHQEYRLVFRVFSQLIRMRYDTPMAVAIAK